MKRKDILELRKRFKKNHCTFTKMCGCYVNGEKNILTTFRETFLNLEEDEYFKYLDLAKKVLSGTLDNNILELNFPLNENLENDKQLSLMQLKRSGLKSDELLEAFYQSVIDSYDYAGNYLILVFHDAYDVIKKTKDNLNLDESEEVYEYILCAVCPVSLTEPGLRYYEEAKEIKARIRDWVVEMPAHGFVFPAFIDRSADVNSVMYYTKNKKEPHPEFMEEILGCYSRQTAHIQKTAFDSLIKDSVSTDERKSEKIFMEFQENLNDMIENYNAIYDEKDRDPLNLSGKIIKELLEDSGVPEEISYKIEQSYEDNFGSDLPIAENLLDAKVLKERAQKEREVRLEKQVEFLQNKLDQVSKENEEEISVENKEVITEDSSDGLDEVALTETVAKDTPADTSGDDTDFVTDNHPDETSENDEDALSVDSEEIIEAEERDNSNYDVVLHVKPEKIAKIKTELINGQKCIVIPIDENEQATLNGREDLL